MHHLALNAIHIHTPNIAKKDVANKNVADKDIAPSILNAVSIVGAAVYAVSCSPKPSA
jgi:hypothetical protein